VPRATCSPVLGKGTGRPAARGILLHDLAKLIGNLLSQRPDKPLLRHPTAIDRHGQTRDK